LKGYKLYKQAKLRPEAKDSSFVSLCVTLQRLSFDLVIPHKLWASYVDPRTTSELTMLGMTSTTLVLNSGGWSLTCRFSPAAVLMTQHNF